MSSIRCASPLCVGVVLSAMLGMAVEPALAEDAQAGRSVDDEARGLFDAGQAAYDRGSFGAALEYFEQSYELSRRPELLFNIGLAAQRSGEHERARRAYLEYLRVIPEAENRADVEARLAALDARPREETSADPRSSDTTEPDQPHNQPANESSTVWPWIVVGASAAVVIGGGVLLLASSSAISDVEDAPMGSPWSDVSDSYDSAPTLSAFGFALLGVGVAGVGVGTFLLATGDAGPGDAGLGESVAQPGLALRVAPNGLSLRGTF